MTIAPVASQHPKNQFDVVLEYWKEAEGDKVYKQTLCFIRRNDELLMLNRNNKPTQGLWN